MKISSSRHIVAALLIVAIGQGAGFAQEIDSRAVFVHPVDFDRLDAMRGGFNLPSGLNISFGFERVVYINGQLVATTVVHIADIGRMTPQQAQALSEARNGILVQVGPGNVSTGPLPSGGMVIQNTLNDQDIRALSTLEISTNTLGYFQNLNAHAALQDALITAPGSP